MRLVYVSTSQLPSRAANGIQTMRMCEAFAQHGHEVTLVSRSGANTEDPFAFYGVEPVFEIVRCRWPALRGGGLLYGREVASYLLSRRNRTDLVYARAVYGARAAIRAELPVVLELHAPPSNVLRRAYEAWVLRSPRLIRAVTISAALRDEYQRIFPWLVDRVPIIVAHDGASTEQRKVTRPAAVPAWPARTGVLQVGYIGHLYPGKGAELVTRLAAEVPEMDFHLVGGSEDDLARWRQRRLPENVHFHGFVAPSRVDAYRQRFDVLLLPPGRRVAASGGGGNIAPWMSPLKLFEYMASGRPIIASDLPVLREVLQDGENSLLADPDDPSTWAAALRMLAADAALREELAHAARHSLETEYSWMRRAERVLSGLEREGGLL